MGEKLQRHKSGQEREIPKSGMHKTRGNTKARKETGKTRNGGRGVGYRSATKAEKTPCPDVLQNKTTKTYNRCKEAAGIDEKAERGRFRGKDRARKREYGKKLNRGKRGGVYFLGDRRHPGMLELDRGKQEGTVMDPSGKNPNVEGRGKLQTDTRGRPSRDYRGGGPVKSRQDRTEHMETPRSSGGSIGGVRYKVEGGVLSEDMSNLKSLPEVRGTKAEGASEGRGYVSGGKGFLTEG